MRFSLGLKIFGIALFLLTLMMVVAFYSTRLVGRLPHPEPTRSLVWNQLETFAVSSGLHSLSRRWSSPAHRLPKPGKGVSSSPYRRTRRARPELLCGPYEDTVWQRLHPGIRQSRHSRRRPGKKLQPPSGFTGPEPFHPGSDQSPLRARKPAGPGSLLTAGPSPGGFSDLSG